MSEETKEPTAESIIGTVIGAMLTLRPGKNHYTEEVAEVVVGQLGALRGLIESQSARIEELGDKDEALICRDLTAHASND